MEPSKIIIDFKQSRVGQKKESINVTVGEDRLNRIEAALLEKYPIYGILSKSERIDFMFFMLERYMFPE